MENSAKFPQKLPTPGCTAKGDELTAQQSSLPRRQLPCSLQHRPNSQDRGTTSVSSADACDKDKHRVYVGLCVIYSIYRNIS